MKERLKFFISITFVIGYLSSFILSVIYDKSINLSIVLFIFFILFIFITIEEYNSIELYVIVLDLRESNGKFQIMQSKFKITGYLKTYENIIIKEIKKNKDIGRVFILKVIKINKDEYEKPN